MTYKKIGVWSVCGLLILLTGCKREKVQEGIPVVVEKAAVRNVEIFGEYVGRIRARQFVEVRARVEGYLEKMLFEEGKKGGTQSAFVYHQSGFIPCPARQSCGSTEKRSGIGVENRT